MKTKRAWPLRHVLSIATMMIINLYFSSAVAIKATEETPDSTAIGIANTTSTQTGLIANPKCSGYASQYELNGTNATLVCALTANTVSGTYAGYVVTKIESGAFTQSSLFEADISGTITNIGDGAFASCFSLNTVVLSNGVVELGKNCFSYCLSLNSITIPDSLHIIGDKTFYECRMLRSIQLGQGITDIGNRAFAYSGITAITIPASVNYIGQNAFFPCSSLSSIVVNHSNTHYSSLNGVLYNADGTVLIQYPIVKNNSSFTIPDSVACIGENAFAFVSSLRNLTISENVTNIAPTAFYSNKIASFSVATSNPAFISKDGVLYSKNLDTLVSYPVNMQSEITFSTNLQSIGDYAFNSCTNLKTVTIPDTVTQIGEYAFLNCLSLKSVNIGSNVTSIGNFAFYGCSSLTNIVIPDSVTNIGVSAFYGCTALKGVTLGKYVANVGTYSFANCAKTLNIWAKGDAPVMANVFSSGTANTIMYLPGAQGWKSVRGITLRSWDFSPKVQMADTQIVLTWPVGTLLETTNLATGPWVTNTASSPFVISPAPDSPMTFYNVQYSK